MSIKTVFVLTITCLLLSNVEGKSLVLLVVSSSFPDYNTSAIVMPAVRSAVSAISTILPKENLEYIEEDSLCDAERTSEILRKHLQNNSLVAIIGCGCSTATMAIDATMSSLFPEDMLAVVPVVSYASPSTKLSKYPYLFRTIPTFDGIFDAIAQLLYEFEWKQILLITEEINLNTQDFTEFLSTRHITLFSEPVNSNSSFGTENRVFILDAYGNEARNVLCQAFKNRIYYPSYAWLIFDNFIDDDWYTVPDTNCTIQELLRVLDYSISIRTSPSNEKNDIYAYAYDAVMAIALALQRQKIEDQESIADSLRTLSFPGLSGNVSFSASNSAILLTQLESISGSHRLTERLTAVYSDGSLNITEPNNVIWPLGVPSDGIPVIVIDSVKVWAFVASIILSIGGIVLIIICSIFIFIYRKAKVIKLTSPKLNYLLLLGASSVFFSIILYSYPGTDRHVFEVLCPIQPFFGSILGYDLCVTIATVKLWRIYYIFKGPHPSQRIPKDWQLLVVVGILLSIDSLFSVVLIIIDAIWFPPMLIHENKPDSFDPATGEVESFYFWDCRYSTYIFTLIALVHNFTVHGIGIGFAYRLRKIKVTVLNEYRYNLAVLVTSIVITIMTVICIYAIGPDPSLYAFFYSLFVTVGCLVFVGLTFAPKIIALKRDPNGDNIFPDTIGNIEAGVIRDNCSDFNSKSSVKPPSDDQE